MSTNGMKALTDYDIETRQPEEMCVGDLNRIVRELRERLYQERVGRIAAALQQHPATRAVLLAAEHREAALSSGDCGEADVADDELLMAISAWVAVGRPGADRDVHRLLAFTVRELGGTVRVPATALEHIDPGELEVDPEGETTWLEYPARTRPRARQSVDGACLHRGVVALHVLTEPAHPDDLRMWVREQCETCGGQRLAELEYIGSEDEDVRTTGATPWRGGRDESRQ